jgi:hypothetical protein
MNVAAETEAQSEASKGLAVRNDVSRSPLSLRFLACKRR